MKNLDKQRCYGCGACSDICPVQAVCMERDEDGFAYPIVNTAKCTDCGLCTVVCAFTSDVSDGTNPPSLSAYGAKHTALVRRKSTSGGVFTALSDRILLDHGVVYGAAFDENLRLRHKRAQTKELRDLQRGSKYVQSDTAGIFLSVEKDLLAGAKVLFSGCPCQVDALKRYLSLRPGLKAASERLYLLDILCCGVPSPQLFEDYIAFVQRRKKKRVTGFTFRNKEKPWGIHNEQIIFADGTTDSQSVLSQGYKNLFGLNIAFRPACYECPYAGSQRAGDITLGDFWGIDKVMPEFRDTLGVSAVLVNTQQGLNLINDSRVALELRKCTAEDVFRHNHRRPFFEKKGASRTFYRVYTKQGIEAVLTQYGQLNCLGRMKSLFYSIVGENFKPQMLIRLYQAVKEKNAG